MEKSKSKNQIEKSKISRKKNVKNNIKSRPLHENVKNVKNKKESQIKD